MGRVEAFPRFLENGATVAIIGGGPAGCFSALHLLNQARKRGLQLRIVLFERNCQPEADSDTPASSYSGCPQCAGGISPRLCDALSALDIGINPEIIQSEINTISVQGCWKSVFLPVPRNRKLYSVYRGTLPYGQHHDQCFDAMMINRAAEAGAELIGARVKSVKYQADDSLQLIYQQDDQDRQLEADFVVFAGGVNEKIARTAPGPSLMQIFQELQPGFVPPRLRKALIFELEAPPAESQESTGELHFIESSTPELRLEMCSVLSKSGYITVTLVGKSVDQAESHYENMEVIKAFLALPQIIHILNAKKTPVICCVCNPSLVVAGATKPYGERVAVVGDMATSRQYKDGILSAHTMAKSLALSVFDDGIDEKSLQEGYGASLAQFRRDNEYASVIFFFYRWFFTNRFFSRVIYQTFASEKKSRPEKLRHFKRIFWNISSGDAAYKDIAWAMLRPSTLWLILRGGVYPTLRNGLVEHFFGLQWRGVSRVPTVVSRREHKAKRAQVLPDETRRSLAGRLPQFECMYTVNIRSEPREIFRLLEKFGEKDRPYLNPRWVSIRRTGELPLRVGSQISYSVFGGFLEFSIELDRIVDDRLLVYKVVDGFAHGGVFVFEIEPVARGRCNLTIYLAFDYFRGETYPQRIYWRLFRLLFPEFIHEVLWNHALCEFKHCIETKGRELTP